MSAILTAPLKEERRLMTTEEFDSLPEDDSVERWIIDGFLYERPMARRSFPHSKTEAKIVRVAVSEIFA